MNVQKLNAAAALKGLSNLDLAKRLDLSNQAFYNKLNGKTEFKNSEILRLSQILALSLDAVNDIFFDGILK